MSKHNSQKQGKLKVSAEDFIEPLLKRLPDCSKNTFIGKLRSFFRVKKNGMEDRQMGDNELISLFGEIERQIDLWEENKGSEENYGDDNELIENFKELLKKHGVDVSGYSPESIRDTSKFQKKRSTTEVGGPSANNKHENDGSAKLEELDTRQKNCLNSLGIFPKIVELKKRLLVHWWIGLGLVTSEGNITPEQQGQKIFSDLVDKGILKPVYTKKHNEVTDKCILDPTIHQLIPTYDHRKQELVTHNHALLNVGHSYLSSEEIKEIFSHNNALQVVQLGRWHDTAEVQLDDNIVTKGKESWDHIEVDDTDFLKKLGKNVSYISLRDISGIDGLPESIGKQDDLRILDLRSCHNLQNLPQKRHSRLIQKKRKWFKNLTYLDISECYMLDHIPKWICELSNLEVLKGFITGSKGKKNKVCQLGDLSKLKKLRKLGIRITKPIDNPNDARGLESLDSLSVVTIIWNCINENGMVPIISFPKNLEKLDIRGYPEADLTKLLPEVVPSLKRLYIRHGNLNRLGLNNTWKVETLRLRFLKNLESDWPKITGMFKALESIEYIACPNLFGFPFRPGAWNTRTDGPFPIIDDDYFLKANLEAPKDISGRVELKIINNTEAPLDENKQTFMIKLTGGLYNVGPGLDLVAVLDVGESMKKDNRLENMKAAILFVINEFVYSSDRFSIVTFAHWATVLWPLQKMTKDSREKLKDLVNNLKTTNCPGRFDRGLQKGLDILHNPRISSPYRVKSVMLVASANIAEIKVDIHSLPRENDVAIHVFGFAEYNGYLWRKLYDIASVRSASVITNTNNLTKAVAVCLAGLFTVVVQELQLTITPIQEKSKASPIVHLYRCTTFDNGSSIINFCELYSREVRMVLVKLLLPAVDEDGPTDVLQVSYSYKLSGQIFKSNPVIITVNRMKTVSAEMQQAPQVVIAAEARNNSLYIVKRDCDKGIDALKSLENLDDELSELLRDELKELTRSKLHLHSTRFAYSCSLYLSHHVQRAATRGDDIEKSIKSFGTPVMFEFLKRAS